MSGFLRFFADQDCSMNRKLSVIELLTLLLVLVMLSIGYLTFFTNRERFLEYVAEDHAIEWGTVLGLMLGFVVSISRFFRLIGKRSWWFLLVTLLLASFLFIVAGEEISWGQRLLGIQSSEYFKENNAQGETNLHNMMVGGVKVNRIITIVLFIGMTVYLVVFPILYKKSQWWNGFLNRSAVPVPRVYQIIAFALMAAAAQLIPDGKNAELLECGAALIFFLVILFPVNKEIFERRSS